MGCMGLKLNRQTNNLTFFIFYSRNSFFFFPIRKGRREGAAGP